MQTAQRLTQLIKEITKYCDDHHKKQKQIKTEETATIEAINELKETISAHNKVNIICLNIILNPKTIIICRQKNFIMQKLLKLIV